MAIHKLSALTVERLSKVAGTHGDGGGLWLRTVLSHKGRDAHQCSWIYRYDMNGRERVMGLGSYPVVTLEEARELAMEARRARAKGIDPVDAKRAQKAAARVAAAKARTFKECAEAYIKANKASWKNDKHAAQWESTLATYVYPEIGSTAVGDLDTPAVLRVVQPIWESKSETASRVRGRIETVLNYAKAQGFREGDNPAAWSVLKHILPKPQKGDHYPALPYAELPAFMAQLRGYSSTSALALEFTILTAARTNETIEAPWSEIDGDVWTVPKERMKGGREHRVPLCARALAILNEMRGKGERVFPLSNAAMSELLKGMNDARTKAGLPKWVDPKQNNEDVVVHGFRSTFSDWITEETEFARETREAALAHAFGDKAERAYKRGDALAKRRRLMEAWAAYCEQTAAVDNVANRDAVVRRGGLTSHSC
jgi:integrase